MLQPELALRPLVLGLLRQEVDSDVTVSDRGGVGRPVMLTQHLGPDSCVEGAALPAWPRPSACPAPCWDSTLYRPRSKATAPRSHHPAPAGL